MVVAALVVSILALLLCGLVALAVMELAADRPSEPGEPAEDSIQEFDLPEGVEGTAAGVHGLPDRIDGTAAHLALVMSPVCATCQRLAASFEGAVPDQLTVVVTAADPVRMRKWASAAGLPLEEVVFDDDMSIVNSLGVSSSPAAVGFVRGRTAFAVNLGSRRALDDLMAQRTVILDEAAGSAPIGSDTRPVSTSRDADMGTT